jgi:spore germination protein KA
MDETKKQPALTKDLNSNISLVKNIFKDDDTLYARYIENQTDNSIRCCIFYVEGMVNDDVLNRDVIKPFLEYMFRVTRKSDLIDVIAKRAVSSGTTEKTSDLNKIIQAIVIGDSVMLTDGCRDALILNTKRWTMRAVEEPQVEKVLRGPREGFNESLIVNLTMLRRRLRTQELKFKFRTFGERSQTKGCICYLEGIVNKGVLAELEKRLDQFSIDGTLDTNYISEFICDARFSAFQTTGSTERPDVVAGKLLEGRVALFLDGTPVVLTAPLLFIENFQSNDDYYLSYVFATIGRFLRLFGFILSISIPAVYIALTCFHHEMLPTPLLMTVALARQSVPLPTVVEAFLMLVMFEILRETGSRIPSTIGQSISIVGALVIGQAAVDARLVSSPMIVIIATAGITGLLVPRIKGGTIVIRVVLLLLSSIIGLYGYIFGMMGLFLYLFNLKSFGIPVMTSAFEEGLQNKRDIYFRAPWPNMRRRPGYIAADKVRSSEGREPE